MISTAPTQELQLEEFRKAKRRLLAFSPDAERIDLLQAVSALIDEADDLGADGVRQVLNVANNLRDKRAFGMLLILTMFAERAGLGSPKLKRLEIQALIEVGRLREALRGADQMIETYSLSDPAKCPDPECLNHWREGLGARGRAYKQVYMDAAARHAAWAHGARSKAEPAGPDLSDLQRAVEAYSEVWHRREEWDKRHGLTTEPPTYQAINAAALMMRAARDRNAGPPHPTWADPQVAQTVASQILRAHETETQQLIAGGGEAYIKANPWHVVTCGEACLVEMEYYQRIGEPQQAAAYGADAERFYGIYAAHPSITAFQVASSLRQLEEVWGYSGEQDTTGGRIVRLLKAALLSAEPVLADQQAPEDSVQTQSTLLSLREAELLERDLDAQASPTAPTPIGLQAYEATTAAREKNNDTPLDSVTGAPPAAESGPTFVPVRHMMMAMDRRRAVCAIISSKAGKTSRIGTGFALEGGLLKPEWAGQPVILTNNHVAGATVGQMASNFRNCRAQFYRFDPETGDIAPTTIDFEQLLYFSPPEEHDVVVLKPARDLPDFAKALGAISDYLPRRREARRDGTDMNVSIVGFPMGEDMSLSVGNEMLLDHDACDPGATPEEGYVPDGRCVRLHYRTPTQPGNSGSPVFQTSTWTLIGIHRAGSGDMQRLPTKEGPYRANEGAWLPAIRAAIANFDSSEAESLAGLDSLRHAALAVARSPLADMAKRVVARPIGATAPDPVVGTASARPAAAPFPTLAGHFKRYSDDREEVSRLYLQSGWYSGESLDGFRRAGRETVIGNDDRQQIMHTTASPFRMICSITVFVGGRIAELGTGFLIGENTLLTAGHCLKRHAQAPEPERILIRPGRNGHFEPFETTFGGPVEGSSYSLHPVWSDRFDPRFDLGAIHLNKGIGSKLGWFRVGAPPADNLRHRWAHVTGYPGDKFDPLVNESDKRASELWHHATPIDGVGDGVIYYPADTYAGQSGAPVYVLDDDDMARVVGVHAYGLNSSADPKATNNNMGILLDEDMVQVIAGWKAI